MRLFVVILSAISLARAGQIYHGTTQTTDYSHQPQDIYQSELAQQAAYQPDQSAYINNNNFQSQHLARAEKNARILSYQSDKSDYGYQYAYETDNGIKAQEVGQSQGKGHAVQGAYSYTGDDGQVYTVTYTADENGFHPQGAHLPTPPPVPEAIARSLEKIAQSEANGVLDDGRYKEDSQQYNQQQNIGQEQYQHQQQLYSQAQYSQNLPTAATHYHTTDAVQAPQYDTTAYQGPVPTAESGHY